MVKTKKRKCNKRKYNKRKSYKRLGNKRIINKIYGGGTGRDIVTLLQNVIDIYDSSGEDSVIEFLNDNMISLHQDETNKSSIKDNIANIRNLINMFYEKYAENLEEGYTEFDEQAIGNYNCLDARVEAFTKFLTIDNPFETGRPVDQILGSAFNKLKNEMCNDLDNINNIESIKTNLIEKFREYIPKHVTEDTINTFVDTYIPYYLNEEGLLDCTDLIRLKIDKKIKDTTLLKKDTILIGKNNNTLGKLLFDINYPINKFTFATDKGMVNKNDIQKFIYGDDVYVY